MDTEKERVIHDVMPENHMGLTLLAVARELLFHRHNF